MSRHSEWTVFTVLEKITTRKLYDRGLMLKIDLEKRLNSVHPEFNQNNAVVCSRPSVEQERETLRNSLCFSFDIYIFTDEEYARVQRVLFKLGCLWQSNRKYNSFNKIYRKHTGKTFADGERLLTHKTVLVQGGAMSYSGGTFWRYNDHFTSYDSLMEFLTREFSLGVTKNGVIKRLSRPDI